MQRGADAAYLREQATKCRRIAAALTDEGAVAALRKMADEYELQASFLDGPPPTDGVIRPGMPPQA
jgi:hypothetical protein